MAGMIDCPDCGGGGLGDAPGGYCGRCYGSGRIPDRSDPKDD